MLGSKHAQFAAAESVEGDGENEKDYYYNHKGPIVVEDMVGVGRGRWGR